MDIFSRETLPVVVQTEDVEIRAGQSGGMVMMFYRFAPGADLRQYLRGLPGDACTCPHWTYVISGKLRVHTASGDHDVAAGQAFYVEPGHFPTALEETVLFEVSPLEELLPVGDHILHRLAS